MVKKALNPQRDFTAASRAWQQVTSVLGPISLEFTKRNADAITGLINEMLNGGGLRMDDPLVEFLMDWIGEFERQFVHLEEAEPLDVLRHLMMANDLRQIDLANELGGQSVVSAILSGKREINVRQARALAARFCVSAAVFIETGEAKHAPTLKREFTHAHPTQVEVVGASQVVPHYLNEIHVTLYQ